MWCSRRTIEAPIELRRIHKPSNGQNAVRSSVTEDPLTMYLFANVFDALQRFCVAKQIRAFSCGAVLYFVLSATNVHAANWYVRPNGGSYGSQNGTSWSNAYNGFGSIAWASVICGDTIW